MQPAPYHKLLLQQIGDSLGATPQLTPPLQALLQRISAAYGAFDTSYLELHELAERRTQQLLASTSRAYSFLDSLHMGFIMCDVHGEVVLTNDSVRQLLTAEAPMEAQAAQPVQSWTLETLDARFGPEVGLKPLILQCLENAQPIERNEVNLGTRVVRLFIAPLQAESEGKKQLLGAVILAEDITEQKVLERSKDEFLSIASHELRTPLTAIRGNAALIKKHYADKINDQALTEMIDDIHSSSIRLIDIVNDFLDASSLEQGKMQMNPEDFALPEIITEVVRELQSVCQAKGIKLAADPAISATPPVHADKTRIKQVIYNLVGNATKFTEEGSIIISTRWDESAVYTVVTDTGRGISPEGQRLLFRKFQQAGSSLLTRDTTKGTGLGLYISKLIVELSGGRIGLEHTAVDRGSSFAFSLPRPSSA